MNNNTLTARDYAILFLTFLFFLHRSSFIAFNTPAILWQVIVISLFLLLAFFCAKTKNVILYLFPIVVIDIIWKILKSTTLFEPVGFAQFISGIMQYSIFPLLTYYLFRKGNIKLFIYVIFVFLLVEITTGISTIFASYIDPTLARMDYGTVRTENPQLYAFRMLLNVGDYHTTYGFTAMLPIFILIYKWAHVFPRHIMMRLLSLLVVFISVYTVYSASYTISLAICCLMLLLFLCPAKINKTFFVSSLFLSIFLAFLLKQMIPFALETIAGHLDDPIMTERLLDLAKSIEYGEDTSASGSDFNERMICYEKSWSGFLSNPFWGNMNYELSGGHSFILDNLGLMGLLGVGLLIIMLKTIWKRYISIFKMYPWFYYYGYALIAILVFFFLNPDDMSEQLLFFYPVSGYVIVHYTKLNYK